MRVTVTGAGGFIGRAVVRAFETAGHEASPWRDLQQPAPAADTIVHLAASSRHATAAREDDLDSIERVLDACAKQDAACVFASTAGVYGSTGRTPVAEKAPLQPINAYADTKRAAEERCGAAAASGVACTVLRLFNVYGPGQRSPFVIADIVESLAAGRRPELRMPDAVRDFVFVDDVARAFVTASLTAHGALRVINIGSGVGVRVRDVVDAAARLLDVDAEWSPVAAGGEVEWSVADINRAREEIGWSPAVTFESGLAATCAHARRATANL